MAEVPVQRPYQQQQMQRPGQQQQQQLPHFTDTVKGLLPDKGPSASQLAAVATLLPLGGILLALAGITLTGTVIGLCIATPVFVIFSPVIVPAAIAIGLAVMGFLTSGALGVTGISSLAWIFNYFRSMRGTVPEQLEHAKRRVQEAVGQVGERTKDVGQAITGRAGQEGGRPTSEAGRT